MAKKTVEKPIKIRRNGRVILLFGIVAGLMAGFALFTAIDLLYTQQGLSRPLLALCFAVLFFIISVMTNKTAKESQTWKRSLFIALSAQTAIEIILLPFLGANIRTPQIICCVLTAAAALILFLDRRDTQGDEEIPRVLAVISALTGLLIFNLCARLLVSGGNFSRLWIGIFFTGFFAILTWTLVTKAWPVKEQYRALLRLLILSLVLQCTALLVSVIRHADSGLLIFQICLAAALAAGTAICGTKNRQAKALQKKK